MAAIGLVHRDAEHFLLPKDFRPAALPVRRPAGARHLDAVRRRRAAVYRRRLLPDGRHRDPPRRPRRLRLPRPDPKPEPAQAKNVTLVPRPGESVVQVDARGQELSPRSRRRRPGPRRGTSSRSASSSSSSSKGSSSSTTWTAASSAEAAAPSKPTSSATSSCSSSSCAPSSGATRRPERSIADLGTADVLAVLGVRVGVRLLLGDPLVQRLPLERLVGRRTESFARGPLLRRRVALVEQIVDTPVVQGVLRLQLVLVVDAVAAVVLAVVHPSCPHPDRRRRSRSKPGAR